jgi:hypothetical protein
MCVCCVSGAWCVLCAPQGPVILKGLCVCIYIGPNCLTGGLRVVSENNFPTAAGLASSASGLSVFVSHSFLFLSLPLPLLHGRSLAGSSARALALFQSLSLSCSASLTLSRSLSRALISLSLSLTTKNKACLQNQLTHLKTGYACLITALPYLTKKNRVCVPCSSTCLPLRYQRRYFHDCAPGAVPPPPYRTHLSLPLSLCLFVCQPPSYGVNLGFSLDVYAC